ncbi:hypothetical protein ACRALDRAFT_2048712 [Sodiomyces alcalophilus JCM 7366]|uniref:uncharacterized protein n=1 Tax=Sodiomyces alcalophilus JCM 7366 TaxID=591952 RepID=UPI0039B48E08
MPTPGREAATSTAICQEPESLSQNVKDISTSGALHWRMMCSLVPLHFLHLTSLPARFTPMHDIVGYILRTSRITAVFRGIFTACNALRWLFGTALWRLVSGSTAEPERFPLTFEQQEARSKRFIESLDEDAIASLASRHNDGKDCWVFFSKSGSFNACFFVEFLGEATRWVVRVPVEPVVHDAFDKIQREGRSSRYIRSRTTIRVPQIYAWGREPLTQGQSGLQAYMILEHVPGRSLDTRALVKAPREQRDYLYSQLVDVFAQLRQLELPFAGSLIPGATDGSDPMVGPLCSMHVNEMQLHGSKAAAPPAPFTSTNDFILHQLSLIEEVYRLPNAEQSLEDAQREVFALTHLRRVLLADFVRTDAQDDDPFVLCHLDLRGDNIIVDDNLQIQAIIDWEWAGSVPRQFFTPPSWIAGLGPSYVTGKEYRTELAQFHKVLLAKSETSEAHRLLCKEWDPEVLFRKRLLPVAIMLQHHSRLVAVFFRALYPELFEGPEVDVVPGFFERHENRDLAVEARRQVERSERFTRHLQGMGINTKPDTVAEKRQELARRVEKLKRELERPTNGLD